MPDNNVINVYRLKVEDTLARVRLVEFGVPQSIVNDLAEVLALSHSIAYHEGAIAVTDLLKKKG